MLGFRDYYYLTEIIDPVELGKRASRRYGRSSNYGEFFKGAIIGQHIPLKNFDENKSEEATYKMLDVQNSLGPRREGIEKYWNERVKKRKFKIKDLHPTQPYVRTDNEDILRKKIGITNPDHIHVVRHEGKDYVMNGHHAILAARLRGERNVEGSFYNLDTHKN